MPKIPLHATGYLSTAQREALSWRTSHPTIFPLRDIVHTFRNGWRLEARSACGCQFKWIYGGSRFGFISCRSCNGKIVRPKFYYRKNLSRLEFQIVRRAPK